MKKVIILLLLIPFAYLGFSQEKQTQEPTKRELKKKARKERKEQKKIKPYIFIPISVNSTSDIVPDEIKSNSQIVFELNDANTFLYSIEITEKQRDNINDEELSNNVLKEQFKPSDFKITPLGPNVFFNNPSSSQKDDLVDSISQAILKTDRTIQFQRNELDKLLKAQVRNEEKLIYLVKVEISKIESDTSLDENQKNILKNKIYFEDGTPEIKVSSDINSKIEIAIDSVNRKINSHVTLKETLLEKGNWENYAFDFFLKLGTYSKNIDRINNKIDFYNELLIILYSNENFKVLEKRKKDLLQTYFGDNTNESMILSHSKRLINELDSTFLAISTRYRSMPNKENIKQSFESLTAYHNKIDRIEFEKLFINMVTVYNAINEKNWTVSYQTTRFSEKADKVQYNIKLTPIRNDYSLSTKSIRRNYDFNLIGGIKVDFSAGLFFNFDLNDDDYSFKFESDSSTKIVKNTNAYQFMPSAGAVFNVYYRNNWNIKPALNFGIGTNIEKTYYYLGIGALLGKKERIGISVGVVGGTKRTITDEYKDFYSEGQIIDKPITGLPDAVPTQTKDPFQVGFFVGISYNLSGKNKEQMDGMLK